MTSQVSVVGILGREVELKYTASGQAVASFSLASTKKWKDRQTDEWKEKTAWVPVVAWGELGEHCAETLSVGARVIVLGRMDEDTWNDKDTGKKRSKIQIIADEVGPSLRWATAQINGAQRETPQDKNASNQSGGSISGWSTEDLEAPF